MKESLKDIENTDKNGINQTFLYIKNNHVKKRGVGKMEGTDFGQSRFGHLDLANFDQSNCGQSISGPSIFGCGVYHGEAPKGGAQTQKKWSPKPGKCGAPMGGWGPNFRVFSLSRAIFALFVSLWASSGILVVYEALGP